MNEDELRRLAFTHALDQWRAGEAEYTRLTYRVMMRDWRAKRLNLTQNQASGLMMKYEMFSEDNTQLAWDFLAQRGIQIDDDLAQQSMSRDHETLEIPTEEQYEAYVIHLPEATKEKLRAERDAGRTDLWDELWEAPIRLKPAFAAFFVGFLEGVMDGIEDLNEMTAHLEKA